MENQKVEQIITEFFSLIEKEVQRMEFGTMTVNVQVGQGLPVTQTVNIIKSKRVRYKVDKSTDQ